MKLKKLAVGILAGVMALGGTFSVQAATRSEIAAIQVNKSGSNFKYWAKNSAPQTQLVRYVQDVTNKRSKNYIPPEDRIATFDMDGTILCETAPYYFEWMLYLERALYDANFTPSQADRDYAKDIETAIRETKKFPKNVDIDEAKSQDSVFAGMTPAEYKAYVEKFMEKPVEGLSNLKWGEAFYLPMVEIIKYLQANDFTVYIVTGSDRPATRIIASDLLKIPTGHVIGTNPQYLASHQGNTSADSYAYQHNDYLLRGQLTTKNLKMNKVVAIETEIGKQPVLAFGNSGGDTSMLNYAITGNKYRSMAFMVLCDDLERELGSTSKAENCAKLAGENGWVTISMRNDFKTIYGDKVKRTAN